MRRELTEFDPDATLSEGEVLLDAHVALRVTTAISGRVKTQTGPTGWPRR